MIRLARIPAALGAAPWSRASSGRCCHRSPARIRWFGKDGSVLPPETNCVERGGGSQHGEWSERVRALRAGAEPAAAPESCEPGKGEVPGGASCDSKE